MSAMTCGTAKAGEQFECATRATRIEDLQLHAVADLYELRAMRGRVSPLRCLHREQGKYQGEQQGAHGCVRHPSPL